MRGILAAILVIGATTAGADQADGDRCRATLTAQGKVIYDTALAEPMEGASLYDLLTARVRALVLTGKVGLFDAKPAAEAAAECLRQIHPWPPGG